ncbi:hypothetical protein BU17DRAFT_70700 [Hysterangium stoloniferum]|nr:hypothetical protein BU17DRAFT_70700 [Hysterangium stoloniferum]
MSGGLYPGSVLPVSGTLNIMNNITRRSFFKKQDDSIKRESLLPIKPSSTEKLSISCSTLSSSSRDKENASANTWSTVSASSSTGKLVGLSSVLAMLLVVQCSITYQALAAVGRDNLPVVPDVVRPPSPIQTTIDGSTGNCLLRIRLPPREVIDHHVPVAKGMNAWPSMLPKAKNERQITVGGTGNRAHAEWYSFEDSPSLIIEDNQSSSGCLFFADGRSPPRPQEKTLENVLLIRRGPSGRCRLRQAQFALSSASNCKWSKFQGGRQSQIRSFPVGRSLTATTLHTPTGDVGFCSSHQDSGLKTNQMIDITGYGVNVRSGRIGRWLFGFLDKPALVGSQWKLALWKLVALIIERGTARGGVVRISMGLVQEMSVYGGCVVGDGFSKTTFGEAASIAVLPDLRRIQMITAKESHKRESCIPAIQHSLESGFLGFG